MATHSDVAQVPANLLDVHASVKCYPTSTGKSRATQGSILENRQTSRGGRGGGRGGGGGGGGRGGEGERGREGEGGGERGRGRGGEGERERERGGGRGGQVSHSYNLSSDTTFIKCRRTPF